MTYMERGKRPPICLSCRHLDLDSTSLETPVCVAYPDGIPDEVWAERGDHRTLRGDEEEPAVFELRRGRTVLFLDWQDSFEAEEGEAT